MREIEPLDAKRQFQKDFQEFFDDEIVPIGWSEDQKKRAREITSDTRMNTARVASIPIICRGSECYMADSCPLLAEDLAPIGASCPIESKIVGQLMTGLIEELDVDITSINEVGMIRDLVDQEIQQIRKQSLLSREDIIQENVVGIDESGEPIFKKELHLAVTWEDKIHKRKTSLRKELLANRESRFKAGAQVADDAVTMSKALAEYQKIAKDKERAMLQRVGYDSDVDDYIEAQITEIEKKEEQKDDD